MLETGFCPIFRQKPFLLSLTDSTSSYLWTMDYIYTPKYGILEILYDNETKQNAEM
jgi:hypothetical protein